MRGPFFKSLPSIGASGIGHLEVVRILLAHGADVQIWGGGFGTTPFQVARSFGRVEVAQLLLEQGAERE
jgi:ankyrin repeat protein